MVIGPRFAASSLLIARLINADVPRCFNVQINPLTKLTLTFNYLRKCGFKSVPLNRIIMSNAESNPKKKMRKDPEKLERLVWVDLEVRIFMI